MARTIHRLLNRFVASGTELSALTVSGNSIGAYLTVVGVDSDKVTVSLCAEAEGANDKAARNRAEQIHLTRIGDEIVLEVGEFSTQQRATGHLEILAPKERPIRIAGAFDEILINGMTRAVQVDAPRASVSILKTSGEVSVVARSIIYAGSSGVVKLHAETMDTSHIDIKITANCFDGSFEAIASGLIRVLVPADFSGIQAIEGRNPGVIPTKVWQKHDPRLFRLRSLPLLRRTLWFAFFNFCRVHKTLRVTPAMEAGIADHVWDLAELLK